MKLLWGLFILLMAVMISAVAAYFSIIGLAALFAAAFLPVVVMGATLEAGKLVAVSWLKLNWKNKNVGFFHKFYLTLAVAILMAITSIGIYGFLARGHLEQEGPIAGVELRIESVQNRIETVERDNERLEGRLQQLDESIDVFFREGFATRGLEAREAQAEERQTIADDINANLDEIVALNDEIIELRAQIADVTAKLGPLQYVADIIGVDDKTVAVQMIILLIMIAFDPLAVVLVLSATVTIGEWLAERRARKTATKDTGGGGGTVTPVAPPPPSPPIVSELAAMPRVDGSPLSPEQPPKPVAVEAPTKAPAKKPRKRTKAQTEAMIDAAVRTLVDPPVELTPSGLETAAPERSEKELIVELLERNPDFLQTMIEEMVSAPVERRNADIFKTGDWLVKERN